MTDIHTQSDLAKDLQALEVHLQHILQSPEYAKLINSGYYYPDVTLVDALHAAQEASVCLTTATIEQTNKPDMATLAAQPDREADNLEIACLRSLYGETESDCLLFTFKN